MRKFVKTGTSLLGGKRFENDALKETVTLTGYMDRGQSFLRTVSKVGVTT